MFVLPQASHLIAYLQVLIAGNSAEAVNELASDHADFEAFVRKADEFHEIEMEKVCRFCLACS